MITSSGLKSANTAYQLTEAFEFSTQYMMLWYCFLWSVISIFSSVFQSEMAELFPVDATYC